MGKGNVPESRERIIKTAVVLFAQRGYAGVGLRELAEKAEVNLAMINYFFGGKKKLLMIILDTFFAGYLEILGKELLRDVPFEEKISTFIHQAVAYIARNRDYMIVSLGELPHDDPDITEYKSQWGKKAMAIIEQGICTPLAHRSGKKISPAAIGPLIITMMSSRFLFAPILEKVQPPGYGESFFTEYPDIIATIFLNGINGFSSN
jgi:AcrR family transcriptional regulator